MKIVIKLGGSVITDREKSSPSLKVQTVQKLGAAISKLFQKGHKLVLVLGAGNFGHPLASRYELHKGWKNPAVQRQAMAKVQCQLYSLVQKVLSLWEKYNLPCFPLQASSFLYTSQGKLLEHFSPVLSLFLEQGWIPLLTGVPVADRLQGCAILSGDHIAPYAARLIQADLLIHITAKGGVFAGEKQIPEIRQNNWELIQSHLSSSEHTDVTGGMASKVEAAYRLVQSTSTPVVIAGVEDLLYLPERKVGSWILP